MCVREKEKEKKKKGEMMRIYRFEKLRVYPFVFYKLSLYYTPNIAQHKA